jgi:hypothetical protein
MEAVQTLKIYSPLGLYSLEPVQVKGGSMLAHLPEVKIHRYYKYSMHVIKCDSFDILCSDKWIYNKPNDCEIILSCHGDATCTDIFPCQNYCLTFYGPYGEYLYSLPGQSILSNSLVPYAKVHDGKCSWFNKQTLEMDLDNYAPSITGTNSLSMMKNVFIASMANESLSYKQIIALEKNFTYAYIITRKGTTLKKILTELSYKFGHMRNIHIVTCRGGFDTLCKAVFTLGLKGTYDADKNLVDYTQTNLKTLDSSVMDVLTNSTIENFNLTNHNINLQQLQPTQNTEFFEKDLLKCLVVRKSYYQEIMYSKELKNKKKINWKPGIFTYNEYDKVSALDMCILLLGYSRNQRIVNRLSNAQLKCLEDGTNGQYLTKVAINQNYHSIREMFKACGLI